MEKLILLHYQHDEEIKIPRQFGLVIHRDFTIWSSYKVFTEQEWEEFQVLIPDKFSIFGENYHFNMQEAEIIEDQEKVQCFIKTFGKPEASAKAHLDCTHFKIFDLLEREGLFRRFERDIKRIPEYIDRLMRFRKRYIALLNYGIEKGEIDVENKKIKKILEKINKTEEKFETARTSNINPRVTLLKAYKKHKSDIIYEMNRESGEYTQYEIWYGETVGHATEMYSSKFMQIAVIFDSVLNYKYHIDNPSSIFDLKIFEGDFNRFVESLEYEINKNLLRKYLNESLGTIVDKFIERR